MFLNNSVFHLVFGFPSVVVPYGLVFFNKSAFNNFPWVPSVNRP